MRNNAKNIARGAILGALYAVLTLWQNLLLPGSGSWAVQCRIAEALMVMAFFTRGAAGGLAVGCALVNLTNAGAMPLDALLGAMATYLAARAMWALREKTILGLPLWGLLMPAVFNSVFIGAELWLYMGGGFFLNGGYVALGELLALLGPGIFLYRAMKRRRLDRRLFPE